MKISHYEKKFLSNKKECKNKEGEDLSQKIYFTLEEKIKGEENGY